MQSVLLMSDFGAALMALAVGLAAILIFLKGNSNNNNNQHSQPSSGNGELRALQDSVKLLLEANLRNGTNSAQGTPSSVHYSSRSRRNSGHGRSLSFDNNEEETTSDQTALRHLQRTNGSSSSSAAAAANAIVSTPILGPSVDLYQEVKSLQDTIKTLERRNREYQRQLTLAEVSNVVETERKYVLPLAPSTPGVAPVKLTASEIETVRAVFNLFDTRSEGKISTNEVRALHAKLGEPLTEAEAAAAVGDLDQDGSGEVTFNKFLLWWYENHKAGKKGSQYTGKFKLLHAKISQDAFNVDKIITQESGDKFTLEYRLNFYYKQSNQALRQISPWHDIPLYRVGSGNDGQIYNFICEIPKWTRAKFECATGEMYNPIKQDTQYGQLRYYKHGDLMFNYGFFPQTWEDPHYCPPDTKCPGDNDPIDCVEIGAQQIRTGAVVAVKILGVLALIDDGETDWKIIAIAISDPMAHMIDDVDDVEKHLPGAIKAIRDYFRDYKSFSGKINSYALRGQAMPRNYARQVIEDTHKHWQSLHLVNKKDIIGKGGPATSAAHPSVANANLATDVDLPADQSVGSHAVHSGNEANESS